jgi:hypothetical protein
MSARSLSIPLHLQLETAYPPVPVQHHMPQGSPQFTPFQEADGEGGTEVAVGAGVDVGVGVGVEVAVEVGRGVDVDPATATVKTADTGLEAPKATVTVCDPAAAAGTEKFAA